MFEQVKVVDMHGVEIRCGQSVIIHTEECDTLAEVKDDLLDPAPTVNQQGYWIDVDDGYGLSGQPSYILEVQTDMNNQDTK